MNNLNTTIEIAKQSIKDRVDSGGNWAVEHETETTLRIVSLKTNFSVAYTFDRRMIQDTSCVFTRATTYLKREISSEKFLLFFYDDGILIEGTCITQREGRIIPFDVRWRVEGKNNYRATYLNPLKKAFLRLIENDPKYRLYAVTGLLKTKE